jgi:4,5-DOPA dioxygenase extradiol
LAQQLRALRDENILILGSGNVVHNLRLIHWDRDAKSYPWAEQFNAFFISAIQANDHNSLVYCEDYGDGAHLAIPTPEHYWPALYILALQTEAERAKVLIDGIEMSSISMLSFSIQ